MMTSFLTIKIIAVNLLHDDRVEAMTQRSSEQNLSCGPENPPGLRVFPTAACERTRASARACTPTFDLVLIKYSSAGRDMMGSRGQKGLKHGRALRPGEARFILIRTSGMRSEAQ
jgi:hypothetical protein